MMEEIESIISCPKLRLLHFYVEIRCHHFHRETPGFPRLKRPKIVKNPLIVIYSSYFRTRRMGMPLEKVEKMKDIGWSTISQLFHNQIFGKSIPRLSLSLYISLACSCKLSLVSANFMHPRIEEHFGMPWIKLLCVESIILWKNWDLGINIWIIPKCGFAEGKLIVFTEKNARKSFLNIWSKPRIHRTTVIRLLTTAIRHPRVAIPNPEVSNRIH